MYEGKYGKGLLHPFQKDGQGDYVSGEGEDLLNSDIGVLIGTDKGELRWDTERGTLIRKMIHRRYSEEAAKAVAQYMIGEVIDKYEKRVRVTDVDIKKIEGKLKIYTTYIPLGYSRSVTGATVETEVS